MADQDSTQQQTQSCDSDQGQEQEQEQEQDHDQDQEEEQDEGDHVTFCFEIPRDLLEPLEKCLTLADAELQLNRDPGDVFISWLTPREGLETTDVPIDCKTCATHQGQGICTTHPPGRCISSKLFVNLFTELMELSDAFTNLEMTLSADVPRFAILFEVIAVRASSIMRLAQLFVNAESEEDLSDYIRREPSEDVLTSASCNGIPGAPLIHGKTLLAAFEWATGECEPEDEDDEDDDDKNGEDSVDEDDSDDDSEDDADSDSSSDADDSDSPGDSNTPDDDEEGEWSDSEWSDEDK